MCGQVTPKMGNRVIEHTLAATHPVATAEIYTVISSLRTSNNGDAKAQTRSFSSFPSSISNIYTKLAI
jgi:hypothetical protein